MTLVNSLVYGVGDNPISIFQNIKGKCNGHAKILSISGKSYDKWKLVYPSSTLGTDTLYLKMMDLTGWAHGLEGLTRFSHP